MRDEGQVLLQLARASIAAELGVDGSWPDIDATLRRQAASFVTLQQQGELRGCIGSLEAYRSLYDDVKANAVAAAFSDPRFPPLVSSELAVTMVEVSVLSDLQVMNVQSEQDALTQLRLGVDGIVLSCGARQATFLPQVWDQLPQPDQFMAHLRHKAGLPVDFWQDDLRLYRYTVQKYREMGGRDVE